MYLSTAGACSVFNAIIDLRGPLSIINSQSTWKYGMPWLLYPSPSSSYCFDSSNDITMNLEEKLLHYVVSKFTLNGTWLGYESAHTLFAYCQTPAPMTRFGGGESSDTQWAIFANSKKTTFKCDLSSLLDAGMYFYDLFLMNPDTNKLFPVPVRLVDLNEGSNTLYPGNLCQTEDVLVRRFFLFDTVSGIESGGNTVKPSVIRYASEMILSVYILKDSPNKIYTPVLTIAYQEKPTASISKPTYSSSGKLNDNSVPYTFQSVYSMDLTNFNNDLYGTFVFFTVVFSIICLVRYYNIGTRDARLFTVSVAEITPINYYHYFELMTGIAHSWVIVFFPFTVLVCWYWFVFFKVQSDISVLLPPVFDINAETVSDNGVPQMSPYYWFSVSIHMLFFFQAAYIGDMVYKQSMADIFFIDWEPLSEANKGKPVSVWRTILVANEWSEMTTVRRTSIEITLIFLVFFLLGLKLEYNATQQPDLSNTEEGDLNIVLRFANTTWWWLIISFAQWLIKVCFVERYLSEPPEQTFIDFCTIAKISVIVLENKYSGYYLHCRSPHQFSDGSMQELVEMLHKEEAGLTVDRSLEGAPHDVQSFQIFVSGEWRLAFDKIYKKMVRPTTVNEILTAGRIFKKNTFISKFFGSFQSNSNNPAVNLPPERVMKAWSDMTSFLQDFIENNFSKPGYKRTVLEPRF